MGRYWNGMGRAPLAWQLSPLAPCLPPVYPPSPKCLLIGWGTGRKTPSFCPHRSYSQSESDRKGSEGLTKMMTGEWKEDGRVGGVDANWVESRCRQRPADLTWLEHDKDKVVKISRLSAAQQEIVLHTHIHVKWPFGFHYCGIILLSNSLETGELQWTCEWE